jgi:hypothetical protein
MAILVHSVWPKSQEPPFCVSTARTAYHVSMLYLSVLAGAGRTLSRVPTLASSRNISKLALRTDKYSQKELVVEPVTDVFPVIE